MAIQLSYALNLTDRFSNGLTVELTAAGGNKISVIKVVREVTGLGLKEAKEMVEKGDQVIKEDLEKAAADELKAKLEGAGATVELAPA